jgi:hypothetical protein
MKFVRFKEKKKTSQFSRGRDNWQAQLHRDC